VLTVPLRLIHFLTAASALHVIPQVSHLGCWLLAFFACVDENKNKETNKNNKNKARQQEQQEDEARRTAAQQGHAARLWTFVVFPPRLASHVELNSLEGRIELEA
jgi:hypothetical protein